MEKLTNGNLKSLTKQYSGVLIVTTSLLLLPVVVRYATTRTVTKTEQEVIYCQMTGGLFGMSCSNWQ